MYEKKFAVFLAWKLFLRNISCRPQFRNQKYVGFGNIIFGEKHKTKNSPIFHYNKAHNDDLRTLV